MTKAIEIVDDKLPCNDCGRVLSVVHFSINRARKCGRCSVCKECSSLRKAAWRANNLDYIASYQAVWRAENSEHLKQYDIDRYWNNPEYHRKRIREAMATPEGRAKRVLWEHQRRARVFGLTNNLTVPQWEVLLEYYNYCCLACGHDDVPLTRDHIVPVTKGGALTLLNVQPLCRPCNSSKKQKVIDYR
jgi:5-methylcytosine-specific restriction endonuclease McrA